MVLGASAGARISGLRELWWVCGSPLLMLLFFLLFFRGKYRTSPLRSFESSPQEATKSFWACSGHGPRRPWVLAFQVVGNYSLCLSLNGTGPFSMAVGRRANPEKYDRNRLLHRLVPVI